MCDKRLENILLEYIRLYGLTDEARQYFKENASLSDRFGKDAIESPDNSTKPTS